MVISISIIIMMISLIIANISNSKQTLGQTTPHKLKIYQMVWAALTLAIYSKHLILWTPCISINTCLCVYVLCTFRLWMCVFVFNNWTRTYIEMILLYSYNRRRELKHQRRFCVVCVYVFGFTYAYCSDFTLFMCYLHMSICNERWVPKTCTQYNRRTHMYVYVYVQPYVQTMVNKWTFIY